VIFRGAPDYKPIQFASSFALGDLLRNYITYFLGFFNFLVPELVYYSREIGSTIDAASRLHLVQAIFALAVLGEVFFICVHKKMKFGQIQNVRLIAFGFALFLISMAPYVIYPQRLYLRYSYVGHLGIALMIGVLMSMAAGFFWKRVWKK